MKNIFAGALIVLLMTGCAGLNKADVTVGVEDGQVTAGGTLEASGAGTGIAIDAAPGETPHVAVDSPVIPSVYFDFDSAAIREDEMLRILAAAEALRKFDNVKLVIAGHCDDRGTMQYNQALGLRRAESVRAYLVALGVPAQRISVVSYGKEQPVCTGTSEACRQKNRRARFAIGN